MPLLAVFFKVEDVLRYDGSGGLLSANLDVKNPNAGDAFEHLPPEQLVEEIISKERRILLLMDEIKKDLAAGR